jgi:hypothetical protein
MKDIEANNIETNYKKWSFLFFIIVILINILTFFVVINYTSGFGNEQTFGNTLGVLSLSSTSLFIAGAVLTILSVRKKEAKDYQYKISIWGYPLMFILLMVTVVFG